MLEMHPEYEDYYFNIEKIIIARVGMEIGGKMHTARSRNDLGSTMLRMNVRDTLMKIIPVVYELEKVLLMVLIAEAFTYMCVEMNTLVYRIGVNPNTMDLVVAVVVIVCVLEITRRTCVNILPIIALLPAGYGRSVPDLSGYVYGSDRPGPVRRCSCADYPA